MFGWKLVPIAPTQDQIHAAYKEQPEAINVGFAQAYRTMIVNAPPAPPAAEPFIWICLVAANAEGDADPDPRIRAWTANAARAAQLVEQGLDMVAVYRNPPARSSAGNVEQIAQWLHDETDHPDSYPDHTWPETDRDDGRREGGWVKIVPQHAQAYFRDIARRMVARFMPTEPQTSAMRECLESIANAPQKEPREPDDADWRFRCLSIIEAAKNTLALSRPKSQ